MRLSEGEFYLFPYAAGIFESIMGWEDRFWVQVVPNVQAGSSTIIVQIVVNNLLYKKCTVYVWVGLLYGTRALQ